MYNGDRIDLRGLTWVALLYKADPRHLQPVPHLLTAAGGPPDLLKVSRPVATLAGVALSHCHTLWPSHMPAWNYGHKLCSHIPHINVLVRACVPHISGRDHNPNNSCHFLGGGVV